MSNQRWDLCISHKDKKSDKWRSTKIGVVFMGDDGNLSIRIDPGISISTPEGTNLKGWIPKERDNNQQRGNGGNQRRGGQHESSDSYGGDDGDSIPF